MTAADDHTYLPSPTQRDSAASAIFNLYGYSSRNSSHSQGTFGAFQQGNGVAENGYGRSKSEVPAEEDGAGLVEELRSPRLEDFIDQPNSDPGTAPHDALNRISGSDIDATPTEPMHALGPPVGDSPSTNGRQPLEPPDKYRTSSINRPISISDQQGLSLSSVQESSARNRRRSSAASAVSATRITSPSANPPRTELLGQQVAVSASHLDMSRDNNNQVDSVARRQPGEEEDAYHVRSTYARLEVQGVYGDGWDEGIERTRGRAVMDGKRESQLPPTKNDTLPEQERKALAKVDRYGFFDQALKTRQENRVYRIPAQAFRKVPKVPKAPPTRAKVDRGGQNMMAGGSEDTTGAVPQSISSDEIERLDVSRRETFRRKEVERVGKWERMLLVAERDAGGNVVRWKWDSAGKGRKLSERVFKGIPDRWRAGAWSALIDARTRQRQSQGFDQPDVALLSATYRRSLDIASTYDVQIDLDVPRTISGHILFHTRYGHGQRSLFHVLHCFSTYCSECGYCQGMGPIAATLLCYFDPARVYVLLVRLHDVYNMHGIFIHGFPGLLENFYVQERLIEHIMPDVYAAFEKHMISASSYATKWYITLFANTVPFQTQLRIWDAVLLEGQDVLVITSVALIYAYRSLLTAPNASFETILSTLSAFYIPEDEDLMMHWIHKMMMRSKTRLMMDGWRKAWQELVRNKQDGRALL